LDEERQRLLGVEPDDPFIAQAIAEYGEDRFLYSSDYAHFDCECPRQSKNVRQRGAHT